MKTETYRIVGYNSPKKTRPKFQKLTKRISEKVHAFYNRNDNTRLIAGKLQTKTLKKKLKQRRVLLQNLKTLHMKFLAEGNTKISYTIFMN